jgi:hypothetical protein
MNQIVTKPPAEPGRTNKLPAETDRLPIDVFTVTFDALIAKSNLEAIASRVNDANRLFNALDRASYDRNFSNKLDTPAAIAKLNDLRALTLRRSTTYSTNRPRRHR